MAQAGGKCPFVSAEAAEALKNFFPFEKDDSKAIAADEAWAPPPFSAPSSCTPEQYEQLAHDIKARVEAGDLEAPSLLRLAFHTTTIGAALGRGAGSNGGWLAHDSDRLCPANAGLTGALNGLMELRRSKYPSITHADLFSFAGALGAELAGGPPVAWYPGRPDATRPGPKAPPLSANVPDAMLNAAGVQQHYLRMGLTAREAVLVTGGGHSIGGATVEATGFLGAFTPAGDKWPSPSNKYFIDLVSANWAAVVVPESGHPQYVLLEAEGAAPPAPSEETVFRLPADMALREGSALARWVKVYAADEAKFVADFQRAMQRMLQIGAGRWWEIDTSYQWRGFKGDFAGYGPKVAPLGDDDP